MEKWKLSKVLEKVKFISSLRNREIGVIQKFREMQFIEVCGKSNIYRSLWPVSREK